MKAASSAEHMKMLAVESSTADSQFQQLDKLRMVFEEFAKIGKESIPLAEKSLNELNEELEQKNQSLDDVILYGVAFFFRTIIVSFFLNSNMFFTTESLLLIREGKTGEYLNKKITK